jgi:hypothetical protein
MDDPGWSWPAWKFGLKRSDLFDSLHDQYNTFTFTLQDPEAFHADVYEISHEAESKDDFHRLMADRQRQRLRELHESLESLAVEIIANPKLMDSEHWNYALQLFRTKSFDSLVRYFASYLPEGYMARSESRSGSISSMSDAGSVTTASTMASSVDDAPQYATTSSYIVGPVMTEEPSKMDDDAHIHAPLSPPASETMDSAASPSAETYEHSHASSSNPPSRSMSFSGSESGPFASGFCRSILHRDDEDIGSQSDDCETTVSSVSDCAESRSSIESIVSVEDDKEHVTPPYVEDEVDGDFDEDELLTAQFPEDTFDAIGMDDMDETRDIDETPTPKPEAITTSYLEHKSSFRQWLPSPQYRRSPSPRPHRMGASISRDVRRRSPDEARSKIQKPSPDPIRKRPTGRI